MDHRADVDQNLQSGIGPSGTTSDRPVTTGYLEAPRDISEHQLYTPRSTRTPSPNPALNEYSENTPLVSPPESTPARPNLGLNIANAVDLTSSDSAEQRVEPKTSSNGVSTSVHFTPHVPRNKDNDLGWVPGILWSRTLTTLIIIYLTIGASIGVIWWRAGVDLKFEVSSENVHLIARYFPSIIGTVTAMLFKQTIREYLRMMPYIAMADQRGPRRTIFKSEAGKLWRRCWGFCLRRPLEENRELDRRWGTETNRGIAPWRCVAGSFFPWQDILTTPRSTTTVFSFFCLVVASFIVSLKVALLATQQVADCKWVLTVRTGPAKALIAGYGLMALYTAIIGLILFRRNTGLKWDPVSIADYSALFAQTNALAHFKDLELRHKLSAKRVLPSNIHFRIGYWLRKERDKEDRLVYGIGVVPEATGSSTGRSLTDSNHSVQSPVKSKFQIPRFYSETPDPVPIQSEGCNCERPSSCEHYPYRVNPGYRRWHLFAWIVVIYVSFIGSIVTLGLRYPMHGFHLENKWGRGSNLTNLNATSGPGNWLPIEDPGDPHSTLLYYALLFRSLPTYVAGFFCNDILNSIDLNMRFIQPFVGMFGRFGAKGTAQSTILLGYITASPLQVPLTAWQNSHKKVALFSTLNTLSPLFPIFVGGVFTISSTEKKVQFLFSLSAYIGVVVFLLLYCISLPFGWPQMHRLLPRQFHSIADLMAMCHQSKFLDRTYLDISSRSETPSKEHMNARILLRRDDFRFGIYKGRDGEPHLGFDMSETKETRQAAQGLAEPTPLVYFVMPTRTWLHRWTWRHSSRGRADTRINTTMVEAGSQVDPANTAIDMGPFSQRGRIFHAEDGDYELLPRPPAAHPHTNSRVDTMATTLKQGNLKLETADEGGSGQQSTTTGLQQIRQDLASPRKRTGTVQWADRDTP